MAFSLDFYWGLNVLNSIESDSRCFKLFRLRPFSEFVVVLSARTCSFASSGCLINNIDVFSMYRMETLKKYLPTSDPQGLFELHRIAVRFEEKVHAAATSQVLH